MLMTCNSKKRNNKMDELIPIGQIKSVFFNFAVHAGHCSKRNPLFCYCLSPQQSTPACQENQ